MCRPHAQVSEVAPIAAEFWETATFPHALLPKLGALNVCGLTIQGYDNPVLSQPHSESKQGITFLQQ